ncbi:acylphosphatase [Vibrio gangliei]|uniref:acylphosphatase n=1 Tax=Vibrio gangliei TaxID=2077090 RepID=UPI000D01BB48|nr:acylphosphatase [Vibrio gangliei]
MAEIGRMFIVSGRVQGVGFRYQTAHHALTMGLTGHAKNLNNGDVEVLACGSEQKVEEFHQWLHQGPRTAYVESVQEVETSLFAPRDFAIL